MKRGYLICGLVFCLMFIFLAPNLQAAPQYKAAALGEQQETISETFNRLRDERTKLVEAQSEVVVQANDAKLRVEQIINQTIAEKKTISSQRLESLKKDIEVIKINQEILNTILADIRSATADNEELLPSREYLAKLINLYKDKTEQLLGIAEALEGIAIA